MCAFICVLSYVCSHMFALICVLPCVCSDMSALMCSHMFAPMCSHLCVLITITATSLISFCPPTLFRVSCRHNLGVLTFSIVAPTMYGRAITRIGMNWQREHDGKLLMWMVEDDGFLACFWKNMVALCGFHIFEKAVLTNLFCSMSWW